MKIFFFLAVSALMINDAVACYFPDKSIAKDQRKYQLHLMLKRDDCKALKGIAVVTVDAISCIGPGGKLTGFSELTSKENAQRPNAEDHVATIYNYTGKSISLQGKARTVAVDEGCVDIDKDWEGVLNDGAIEGNPSASGGSAQGFYWDANMGLPKKSFKETCKEMLPDWVKKIVFSRE